MEMRRHGKRQLLPLLIIAFLTSSLTLVSWALASPVQSSPDDDFHLPSIWCGRFASPELCVSLSDTDGLRDGERFVMVPSSIASTPCWAGNRFQPADCALSDVSDGSLIQTRSNDGLYPGLFYDFLSPFASSSPSYSVIIMRIIVAIVSNIAIFSTCLALSPRLAGLLHFRAFLASTPLGLFIFASTNPSSFAVVGFFVFAVSGITLSARAAEQSGLESNYRRWHLLAMVGTLLTCSSRADAAILVFILSVIIVVVSFRPSLHHVKRLWSVVTCGVLALPVGILSGTQSSAAASGLNPRDSLRPLVDRFFSVLIDIPAYFWGLFGIGTYERAYWGLGWLDTPLPSLVIAIWLPALLIICAPIKALQKQRQILSLLTAVSIGIPVYVLVRGGYVVGQNVQPRYMLGCVFVVGFLLPFRLANSVRATRLAVAGATVAHAVTLHQVIQRFVSGNAVISLNLDSEPSWWWDRAPVGPMAIWILGSCAFGLLGVVGLRLARTSSGE